MRYAAKGKIWANDTVAIGKQILGLEDTKRQWCQKKDITGRTKKEGGWIDDCRLQMIVSLDVTHGSSSFSATLLASAFN